VGAHGAKMQNMTLTGKDKNQIIDASSKRFLKIVNFWGHD